jgi:hypothetical protein
LSRIWRLVLPEDPAIRQAGDQPMVTWPESEARIETLETVEKILKATIRRPEGRSGGNAHPIGGGEGG